MPDLTRPARTSRLLRLGAAASAAVMLVSACGSQPTANPGGERTGDTSSPSTTPAAKAGSDEREVAQLNPRVVVAREGGLSTIDTVTGQVVSDLAHPGFLRVNNAGDGRHVMISDSDVFRVYDAGIKAEKHGDHYHFKTATPGMTQTEYAAPHAGHVVVHDGRTTLFADGSGAIQTVDSDDIADPHAHIKTAKTDSPHHGVALETQDGHLVTTQGTKDARNTVQVRSGDKVLSQTAQCPGVHGETVAKPTAKGDVVAFGCETGPVVLRDGAFHKIKINDAYGRTGNLAGSPVSPIVLGDYKVDKSAEPERPTRVALIDTVKDSLDLVDLGSAYWFRSLARGPQGEALVLTYDGNLNVIDPSTRKVTRKVAVVQPWQEKKDWQEPGPALKVAGDVAYVTDAQNKKLVTVDLTSGKVTKTIDLAHTPVEFAVVTGKPEAPEHKHEDKDGHTQGHTH